MKLANGVSGLSLRQSFKNNFKQLDTGLLHKSTTLDVHGDTFSTNLSYPNLTRSRRFSFRSFNDFSTALLTAVKFYLQYAVSHPD